jgi:3-hydroxyacyl-CoA dehydrogenase
MKIQKAAVIGAGTMGAGIAQVLSQAGIEVILKDIAQDMLDRGMSNIRRMYDSRVKREVLTQAEADFLIANVKASTTYDGFQDVDLVIEAALETIDLKLKIFQDLDTHCSPNTILASNTSALSISEIAAHTKRPERVLGMHFFNPAQTMKLVEVIPGLRTGPAIVEQMMELCRDLHKIPVKVEECPGFLVNRVLFPYLNEALHVLEEGNATPEQIDKAAVEFGLPMGPFTLFDMTGLDVCLHVENFLYGEYGERFKPAAILKLLVEKGHLGQKSGAGFFKHEKGQVPKKDEPKQLNADLQGLLEIAAKGRQKGKASRPFDVHRIIWPMFNEAIFAVQEHVVQPQDVDVAMEHGTGLKRGLLSLSEEKGFDWCIKEMDQYKEGYGERFCPAWLLRKLVRARVHDFSQLEQTAVGVR